MGNLQSDVSKKEMLEFPPLSNESIREAVRLWRHDQAQATEKYNHINKWNTSQVTDMRQLFNYYKTFNENISEWDVSNVTDMSYMFRGASSFDQDVSKWDVSNVNKMSSMFYCSSSFNQDVSSWDVSNVTDMRLMFCCASSFNQDVSSWDVSNVTSMSHMFYKASSFDQDVSGWDVSQFIAAVDMIVGTEVQAALVRCCGRDSFFDADCLTMCRSERQQLFSAAFPWCRRKSFVMFLVSQGYLYHSNLMTVDCERVPELCDTLFDVEDLDRVISKFL